MVRDHLTTVKWPEPCESGGGASGRVGVEDRLRPSPFMEGAHPRHV